MALTEHIGESNYFLVRYGGKSQTIPFVGAGRDMRDAKRRAFELQKDHEDGSVCVFRQWPGLNVEGIGS